MGPYVAVNAVLIGLFGFAAVYHFVLWSQSRRDTVLLVFAIHCTLCSLLSGCLIALVTVRTAAEGQRSSTAVWSSRPWPRSRLSGCFR